MPNTDPRIGIDDDEDEPSGGGSRRTVLVVSGIIVAIIIIAFVVIPLLSGGSPKASVGAPTDASASASPSAPPATTAPATEAPLPTVPSVAPSAVEQPPPADPVPIDEPAEIAPALTARITSIEAVEGEAQGPGEVAAPSIRVTVEIANETDAQSSLANAAVTAYFGEDLTPAPELREPGGKPFPAAVPAGGTAEAVYIFSVPKSERGDVTIMVDYALEYAPLQFHGSVPR
ncbi:hypothetical protein SAMN05428970_2939 [Agromyces sp. CF514]|uniref:hypothetical protein n=1 Tax=Agromyces sp. CF514 TaxID=1881031 RepID=UPI0008F00D98|nr:hypothetical protein [Agromyces sp. CF514]SFR84162.1 hypothetical protein SAMN05428970_2939 [Agromyces sp. CF514]